MVPSNRLGAFVVLGDDAAQLTGEIATDVKIPRASRSRFPLRELQLDLVEPEPKVGDLRRPIGRQVVLASDAEREQDQKPT
jgi:hypothetical protein